MSAPGPHGVEVERRPDSVVLRFAYAEQLSTKEGRERSFHADRKGSHERRVYRIDAEVEIPVLDAAAHPVVARAKTYGSGTKGTRAWRMVDGRPMRSFDRDEHRSFTHVAFDDLVERMRTQGARSDPNPFFAHAHPYLREHTPTLEAADVREVEDDEVRVGLERMRLAASRMALIDGVLWEPARLPTWTYQANKALTAINFEPNAPVYDIILPVETEWMSERDAHTDKYGVIEVYDPTVYDLDGHLAEVGVHALDEVTKEAFSKARTLSDEGVRGLVDLRAALLTLKEDVMSPSEKLATVSHAFDAFPDKGVAEGFYVYKRFQERLEASAPVRALDGLGMAP